MQVNSTASYSPSYTANYAAAQQAKSKASTKVSYEHVPSETPKASFAAQSKVNNELAQKTGRHLDTKA